MKEFVVGAPYTTETALDQDDEFLIVACDGVSRAKRSTKIISLPPD
jgi:serine/threonine protein phosphatase PrpC